MSNNALNLLLKNPKEAGHAELLTQIAWVIALKGADGKSSKPKLTEEDFVIALAVIRAISEHLHSKDDLYDQ